jgi:putative AbiEi antitoxin of type IV toxin-antitoxin system
VHPAWPAARVRDRGGMGAKRRIPPVLPVPCDVLLPLGAKRRTGVDDGRSCDVLLARLATHQSGVVGRAQLEAIGFRRNEIAHRVRTGRLIRIHQGVYAVGHEDVSPRGRMVAALLAAGPGAALSHRTAAHLWMLVPSMPQLAEVTLTNRRPRQRRGLTIHHAKQTKITIHQGLPVTTPSQTLADIKDDRAWSEALYLGLVDRSQAPYGAEPTRSELEGKLLPALKAAGLPRPRVNHRIGRYRPDFLWPEHSSSSRPTAGPRTAIAPPSKTTVRATPTCKRRASRCSASRGAR